MRTNRDAKRALITGVTGQDGSYLAELLLAQGYSVIGVSRARSTAGRARINHLQGAIALKRGDLADQAWLKELLEQTQPHEIYNLAGPSYIGSAGNQSLKHLEAAGLNPVRVLEAARQASPHSRVYQASTSEMFGEAVETPQNEGTVFRPRNLYGAAKLYAHWMTVAYRRRHGLFAVSGILFNHESPRRDPRFVTRKVTKGAAEIRLGASSPLRLGDLEAQRDWGFAGDYVSAMWLMLQQPRPRDYVIATGVSHSVRQLCEIAFNQVGLDYRDFVVVDPRLVRAREHVSLVGDASRARRELGWRPSLNFPELIDKMVEADLAKLRGGASVRDSTFLDSAALPTYGQHDYGNY